MSKPDESYLLNADPAAIDQLYEQYRADKESVDFGWRKFFEGFDLGTGRSEAGGVVSEDVLKEINVLNLINGYRQRGHLFAKTNPLRERRQYSPNLDIENFGLSKDDLEKTFNAGVEVGIGPAKLKDIVALLEQTYCQSIGCEFTYIRDPKRRGWLQERFEKTRNVPDLTTDEKRHFLKKLNQATVFENFIHTKYIGQKRFSVEGLECLIPALDAVIQYGAGLGVDEFVMGMAHRGRLNVLANVFNKQYSAIFGEFEGKVFQNDAEDFEGDVKYHLGYSTDVQTASGKTVHLRLADNPSHLEAVNPVVKGMARAKLDTRCAGDVKRICPILIHGDAAVAGQGIVYETVQMSGLEGYYVGGTMHIVTNNQIGFTTNYLDSRTSTYCTDVAKVTLCPVLHVNADDVEAVVHAVKLAMAYRLEFSSDIFIDLLGYRKYGHNEGDEPRFTQPIMYRLIDKHPNPREIYKQKLMDRGEIDAELAREMEVQFKELLQQKFEEAKGDYKPENTQTGGSAWDGYRHPSIKDFQQEVKTGVDKARLTALGEKITSLPENNLPIRKVQNLFADRKKMLGAGTLDWAMGELLAYATLLDEGHPVRLAGQDVERGTFSHRHAVVKKEDSEDEFVPLQHISENQGRFSIYNSLLSEYAALGFEYGYSTVMPKGLTIWEAQFGDFANGAQIMVDQFIASAETKWGKFSGLTLLLPHGYEGQGPEHSSARPERYLQLCATGNMQVIYPSTPANLFHALRRQLKRDFAVPLVIMSPKSLLRHPLCVSPMDEFEGSFREIIADTAVKKARKVLFCTGKIYYDLLQARNERNISDVAIVRIEQLYPLPEWKLKEVFEQYGDAEYCWVQEEPKNQGYWLHLFRYDWPVNLNYVGRDSSASPATGFKKMHDKEQNGIVDRALS